MSIAPVPATPRLSRTALGADERRVRHQARDAAALMAFSAATSLGVAAIFLLLATLVSRA